MAKNYKFFDTNRGIEVEYVTDALESHETFHVTEVRGLDSVDIQYGIIFDILPYTETDFEVFAKANGLALYVYEDRKSVVENKGGFDLLSFTMPEQAAAGVIDIDANTIVIHVVNGTNVTALVATFTLSDGALAKVSGTLQVSGTTANNFTSSVDYDMTSEMLGTKTFAVTVIVD